MSAPKGKAAIEKKANALERLTIEYLGVEMIAPNSYNPNRQSDSRRRQRQLIASFLGRMESVDPEGVLREYRQTPPTIDAELPLLIDIEVTQE